MIRIVFLALALLPSDRTAAASLSPGAYAADLEVPAADLRGAALIDDAAAQDWLRVHRPDQFPALYAEALNRADLRETLTTFTDPASLREAIIVHDTPTLAAEPDSLMEILATAPELTGHRRSVETAALAWAGLSAETREILAREGIIETAWSGKSLPERIKSLRGAYEAQLLPRLLTAPRESADYARQYVTYLQRLAKVVGEGALTEEIARWTTLNQLAQQTGIPAGSATPREASEPTWGLSEFEKGIFLKKLSAGLIAELKKSRVGFRQARILQERPLRLDVAQIPRSFMQISHGDNRLIIDEYSLASVIAALDWTPRSLLIDADAVRETAIALAHGFLHETIHSAQDSWLQRNRPAHVATPFYSLSSEEEAFLAQAVFLGERMQDEPAYHSVMERLSASRFTQAWTLGEIMERLPRRAAAGPAAFNDYWMNFYTYLPTLSRTGSRAILETLARPDFSVKEASETAAFVGKLRERYREAVAALWTEFRSLDFLPERDGRPAAKS